MEMDADQVAATSDPTGRRAGAVSNSSVGATQDAEANDGSRAVKLGVRKRRQVSTRAARNSRRAAILRINLFRVLLVLAIGGIWEGFAEAGIIDRLFTSQPSRIIVAFWAMIGDVDFWLLDVATTLQEIVAGYLAGVIAGLFVAITLSRLRNIYDVVAPFLTGLYSLPRVALAPLLVLWFGIDLMSKVVLIALIVFFVVFYNTKAGIEAVDRDLVAAVKTMGASDTFIWRRIILPGATPWILTGMRISIAFSLTGAVVGEMVASRHGLGNILITASGSFQTAKVMAVLLILAVTGASLYRAMDKLERRLLKWRPSDAVADQATI